MTSFSLDEFDYESLQKWAIRAEKELSAPLTSLPEWALGQSLSVAPYLTKDEIDTVKTGLNQRAQKFTAGWQNLSYLKRKDFASVTKSLTKIRSLEGHGAILALSEIVHSQHTLDELIRGVSKTEMTIFLELPDFKHDIPLQTFSEGFQGGLAYDPVATQMRTGAFDPEYIFKISEYSKTSNPHGRFYPLQVQSHVFHEAGADQIQELALTIATLVHYLDLLTDMDISPIKALSSIYFSISVGTKYFSEIAKLRAFRILLNQIVDSYNIDKESFTPFIHCQTSSLFADYADGYTSLVRSSAAAMCAVAGGCDALTVIPIESGDDNLDTFERMAQNIPLLLAHESKMNGIADPLAGSYLIEKMTDDMATAAWALFLQIEDRGGVVAYFESGELRKTLDTSYDILLRSFQNKAQQNASVPTSQNTDGTENSKWLIKRNIHEDLRAMAFLNAPKI